MSEQHFDPNRISDPWLREFCDQMPGGYFIYKADEKEELRMRFSDAAMRKNFAS